MRSPDIQYVIQLTQAHIFPMMQSMNSLVSMKNSKKEASGFQLPVSDRVKITRSSNDSALSTDMALCCRKLMRFAENLEAYCHSVRTQTDAISCGFASVHGYHFAKFL